MSVKDITKGFGHKLEDLVVERLGEVSRRLTEHDRAQIRRIGERIAIGAMGAVVGIEDDLVIAEASAKQWLAVFAAEAEITRIALRSAVREMLQEVVSTVATVGKKVLTGV